MKKNILYIISIIGLFSVSQSKAEPIDDIKKGINLASQHKGQWFDFEKNLHSGKFDLLNKHHQQWANFKSNAFTSLNSASTPAAKNQALSSIKNDALKLQDSQAKDHQDFWNKQYKLGQDLAQKQSTERKGLEK